MSKLASWMETVPACGKSTSQAGGKQKPDGQSYWFLIYKEVCMFTLVKEWTCGQIFLPGLLSFPCVNEQLTQIQYNTAVLCGHFRILKGGILFKKRKTVKIVSWRPSRNGKEGQEILTFSHTSPPIHLSPFLKIPYRYYIY